MVYKQRTWSILLWFQLTPASSRALCFCPFRSLKNSGNGYVTTKRGFFMPAGTGSALGAVSSYAPQRRAWAHAPLAGRNRSGRLSAVLRLPGSRPFVIRSPAQNRQTVRMGLTPDSLGNGIPSPHVPAAHPSRTFLPHSHPATAEAGRSGKPPSPVPAFSPASRPSPAGRRTQKKTMPQ